MPNTRHFCPKCGSPLDPRTGRCPKCDARAAENSSRKADGAQPSQPTKPATKREGRRSPRNKDDKPRKPTRAERRARKAAEKEARLASMTRWQKVKRTTGIVIFTSLIALIVLAIGFGALEYFGLVDVPPVTYAMTRLGLEPMSTVETDPMEDGYVPSEDETAFDEGTGTTYANDLLIVMFSGSADAEQRQQAIDSIQGEVVGATPALYEYQVKVPGPKTLSELNDMASKLMADFDYVSLASPDRKMASANATEVTPVAPSDPWGGLFHRVDASDWLDGAFHDSNDNNHWAEEVDAAKAWAYADLLSPITVGVADNSFDLGHEDLQGRMSFATERAEARNHLPGLFFEPTSSEKHGTHVAGILGATADNDHGITGIARNARMLASPFQKDDTETWDSVLLSSLAELVTSGAKVLNFSQGAQNFLSTDAPEFDDASLQNWGNTFAQAMANLMDQGFDFVVVQSAGNGLSDTTRAVDAYQNGFFCSITKDSAIRNSSTTAADVLGRVIIVGNAMYSGDRFVFSPDSGFGAQVSVCAPGHDDYSSVPGSVLPLFKTDSGYDYLSGTSMAAPVVSGVCALVWGADPSLTGPEVKEIVCSNTKYDVKPNASSSNTTSSRLVNAQLAVEAALKGAGKLKDDGTTISIPGGGDPSTERDIVLVLDTSGSMQGTPISETRNAASKFVDSLLGEGANIGVVRYSGSAETVASLSTSNSYLQDAIGSLEADGNTDIDDGLHYAATMLSYSKAEKQAIVLMSDGEPNEGRTGSELIDYANTLKNQGITIYTLGFFQDAENKASAQALMEDLASDGCHYEVASSDDLVYFFGDVADQINGTRFIYVRIDCPVDVTVSNDGQTLSSASADYNLRADFGTLTFEESGEAVGDAEDIDMSGTDTTKILRLKEGPAYELNIQGTGTGTMDYQIGFMDEDNEYTDFRHFEDIEITPATKVDTVAEVSDESRLDIDEDGDGRYDLRLRAEANGYGEEIEVPVALTVMFGIGVACVVASIPLFIRAAKIRNRLDRARQMAPR